MKIFFINATGGGFASQIDLAEGTTIGQLFADKLPGARPEDYLIRRNREPVAHDEVLTEGNRVSITPTKIQGA